MDANQELSRPSLGELIVDLIGAVNRQHAFFDDEEPKDSDGRDEVQEIVQKIDDLYGNRSPA
ncbi:hypothetical protein GOA77_09400 [Sinorhizobium meliloti]|uniref:hypothetical protein n=1 Tax=Rhizobium meliloti TaxID=382 RepID=UPI000404ADB3|nr:hypothetical protein [Sinorhizobium meliloti]ASP84997.1 hypothetical protein CDO26_10575 [Sinorhizobium meliloti]MDW9843622.1 hypothetical protein [Sinorhizobium meliloti]MDW9902077.1 hypothetical protein [Sinorhizobium meliloti]MQW28502.1 hypothetical protein [Sinorhizobium meliloti]RVK61950.1 hypothetical protein CN162_01515 [Sinorhizobium meliloti]